VLKSYTTDLSDVTKLILLDKTTTPSIMSLLLVTWIPVVISGDTERNGLICPDCVISLTSELLIEIRVIDCTSKEDGRVVVLGKEGG
jgi:hypothetical protein